MSNRLFQGIIHQMRDSIDRVIGVVDDTATVISCSDLTRIGETSEYLMLDMGENQDLFVRDGYTYKPFGSKSKPEFAVFVEGSDEMAARYCGILAVALSGIKQYYKPEEMVGKKVMVVTNLKPATLAGMTSEGMLLCAEDADGNLSLMTPEKPMPAGAEIC